MVPLKDSSSILLHASSLCSSWSWSSCSFAWARHTKTPQLKSMALLSIYNKWLLKSIEFYILHNVADSGLSLNGQLLLHSPVSLHTLVQPSASPASLASLRPPHPAPPGQRSSVAWPQRSEGTRNTSDLNKNVETQLNLFTQKQKSRHIFNLEVFILETGLICLPSSAGLHGSGRALCTFLSVCCSAAHWPEPFLFENMLFLSRHIRTISYYLTTFYYRTKVNVGLYTNIKL